MFCHLLLFVETFTAPTPPLPNEHAATARWIAHNNDWGSIATISTIKSLKGKPFANIISYSEGLIGNSTGDLYFGVSDLDQSMIDLKTNNYLTLSLSEFQTSYCTEMKWDAEDPRCGRLSLSGSFVRVDKSDQNYDDALQQLFETHPAMKSWFSMSSHDFYLATMKIEEIWLIDFFGGASIIPLKDYYAGKDHH